MTKYLHKINKHENYIKNVNKKHEYNITLCKDEYHLHYDKYVPPLFCKLTLNDDSIVELEGSGPLTSAMINDYKSKLVSAEIGTQCTSIGNDTFNKCSSLTSIDIPDSVTSIGHAAFTDCKDLTSIDIPSSVTSIGNNAFQNCSSLISIEIPDGVTSIGTSSFNGCTSLTNVVIHDSVTSINNYAFIDCNSLISIIIPSSVTNIGNNAFFNCTSLTSIVSNATTAPTIQSNTFQNIKTDGTLTVPIGSSGYDIWMGTGDYYLGKYNWTNVEQ